MTIVVNGKPHECSADSTVADLVAALGLADRRVAVERNRELVKRADWPSARLAENDELEILHFVGGG